MKNKYLFNARISEEKFREVLKYFSVDLSALTASRLSGLNYRTVHRLYELLRRRVLDLALEEGQEFAGEVEIDESYFGARRLMAFSFSVGSWCSVIAGAVLGCTFSFSFDPAPAILPSRTPG